MLIAGVILLVIFICAFGYYLNKHNIDIRVVSIGKWRVHTTLSSFDVLLHVAFLCRRGLLPDFVGISECKDCVAHGNQRALSRVIGVQFEH
jgi:hypothetical protein